jgi:putative methionine-R-sulfoxide reductase with GAF domain
MSSDEWQQQIPTDVDLQLMELIERAVVEGSLEEFAQGLLPSVAKMMHSCSVFLYVVDSRLIAPRFFQHQLQSQAVLNMEKLCTEQFDRVSGQTDFQPISVSISMTPEGPVNLVLYPLQDKEACIGLLGLVLEKDTTLALPALWDRFLRLIANTISSLIERSKMERQLMYLNTYLTVSSMLAQSIGLHELLETALNCSMDIVSAEAASVLLLDDDKKSFGFYQVEGPAKPVLMTSTLPADKGIAASVLQTNQSEVIDDVQSDPRFYRNIDLVSGFQTRNMIAVPLVAGEERIGVLEVLNKIGGDSFTEEESLLLFSIAEEIAFAIRNAKIFEYLADTYCKQRQGQGSCKGCSRPLGSWTPCVKQREVSI